MIEINQKNPLCINKIMDLIPHRYPFLLIDRVIEVKINDYIRGIKNISINEPQFTGHFLNNPVMPGVLIIEAMAQLSAILVSLTLGGKEDKLVYLMSIDSSKFRKIVTPGDSLLIHTRIEQQRTHVWKFAGTAEVNGQVVAESKFTAMVKDKNIG